MIGTILNAAGILIGGLAGRAAKKPLANTTQQAVKFWLGALTMFVGLRLTWINVGGGFLLVLKQLGIALLALTLGRLAGRLLRLQRLSNLVGQYAKNRIQSAAQGAPASFSDGFVTCAVLFTLTPVGIIGALQDGLAGYWPTLGIKTVMDALAAMSFGPMFGWSVLGSVIPVVAFQGTLTLLSQLLGPQLPLHLIHAINATGGLLVFTVALVIWELKKIELTEYLPSLAVAPLLAWGLGACGVAL